MDGRREKSLLSLPEKIDKVRVGKMPVLYHMLDEKFYFYKSKVIFW